MNRIAASAVLFVVLLAGAYLKGRADNEARHVAAALATAQQQAATLAELAATEEANRMLSRALEDAAYAEPPLPAAAVCLPRSRVLRLNER